MATNKRGWSLAQQTKVINSCPSPLKKGRPEKNFSSCDFDVTSSKSAPVGRDATEVTQDTDTVVSKCGSNRCKTCRHTVENDSFCSNTTGRKYKVESREAVMTCATKKCYLQKMRNSIRRRN